MEISGSITPVTEVWAGAKLSAGPAIQPVSLQDQKEHLLLDSGSFDDNLDPEQSVIPADYALGVGWSVTGTGVDVLGYSATVILDSGEVQAGPDGTLEVKIQDSDDNIAFSDWGGGLFVTVTPANDKAIQQIAYTGSKQYIRVIARILVNSAEFGVQITKYASDVTQDTLLTVLIEAATRRVESVCQRKLITQTWELYLETFPDADYFTVPFGNLQSVSELKYKESDGTEEIMTVTTDYLVDSDNDPGRIVLPYGVSWPSFTPYPINPITLTFICGYGAATADVEPRIKTAIKMLVEDTFNHRDSVHELMSGGNVIENKTVMAILSPSRLWLEV